MKSGISMVNDKVQRVTKSIQSLVDNKVLVGIPQKTARRKGDDANNAAIGYWNEKGVPSKNIPARPFLVPGVKDCESEVGDTLRVGTIAALSGNDGVFQQSLDAAGLIAVSSVKAKITAGAFVPLAPSTLKARESKLKAKGKKYTAVSIAPLIDSGQMRQAVTYIKRKE